MFSWGELQQHVATMRPQTQMPVLEKGTTTKEEALSDYGGVWTDAGASNAPWCQCREDLEPDWVPSRRIVRPHQLPVTHPDHHGSQTSWNNQFAASGGQDVERILLDYSEDFVITVYNHLTGCKTGFSGLWGVRGCFVGLFTSLYDLSDVAAPLVTVKEVSAHEPGIVFVGLECSSKWLH